MNTTHSYHSDGFVHGGIVLAALLLMAFALAGCSGNRAASDAVFDQGETASYLIGAGDSLQIFVWGNPDLSTTVPVRPDGRITTPLVEDVVASGKTPTELAREMEERLSRYIKNPVVTVTVTSFVGRHSEQIRVVGAVTQPQSIPYREQATLLDVMIQVGGLTEFAAGNKATLVRTIDGKQHKLRVRLADLVSEGDISANVAVQPGDVLFVPESLF